MQHIGFLVSNYKGIQTNVYENYKVKEELINKKKKNKTNVKKCIAAKTDMVT